MAHPSTLFATDGGVGGKTGLDFANAADINPGGASDIWTLFNSDVPAAGGTEILQCADGAVAVTAMGQITRDATAANPFRMRGRNAANTADSETILDGGGGAFPIIQGLTADWWQFFNITAQNTDGNSPNYAWDIGSNADFCRWYQCRGLSSYRGFVISSGASYNRLVRCEASDNVSMGFQHDASTGSLVECIADGNGNRGYFGPAQVMLSLASNNSDDGFSNGRFMLGCIAYNNGMHGFDLEAFASTLVDCVAVKNGAFGVDTDANHPALLVNFAHYLNTSGAFDHANRVEVNTIALTADPFIDAAARDFRRNYAAGGGLLLRGIAHPAVDGNWIGYSDIGAVQPIPALGPGREIGLVDPWGLAMGRSRR